MEDQLPTDRDTGDSFAHDTWREPDWTRLPRLEITLTESDDHAVTWADHVRFARGSK